MKIWLIMITMLSYSNCKTRSTMYPNYLTDLTLKYEIKISWVMTHHLNKKLHSDKSDHAPLRESKTRTKSSWHFRNHTWFIIGVDGISSNLTAPKDKKCPNMSSLKAYQSCQSPRDSTYNKLLDYYYTNPNLDFKYSQDAPRTIKEDAGCLTGGSELLILPINDLRTT